MNKRPLVRRLSRRPIPVKIYNIKNAKELRRTGKDQHLRSMMRRTANDIKSIDGISYRIEYEYRLPRAKMRVRGVDGIFKMAHLNEFKDTIEDQNIPYSDGGIRVEDR